MALVELGRFDRQEAYIVQSRLEDGEIMSFVFDSEASMFGSYLLIPVRIMVDDEDEAAARQIIASPA